MRNTHWRVVIITKPAAPFGFFFIKSSLQSPFLTECLHEKILINKIKITGIKPGTARISPCDFPFGLWGLSVLWEGKNPAAVRRLEQRVHWKSTECKIDWKLIVAAAREVAGALCRSQGCWFNPSPATDGYWGFLASAAQIAADSSLCACCLPGCVREEAAKTSQWALEKRRIWSLFNRRVVVEARMSNCW